MNKKAKHNILSDYKKSTSEVRKILNEWDFISVFAHDKDWPKDEYDCLIDPILSILYTETSEEKISDFLHKELKNHFGIESPAEETNQIAINIVTWWNNR